MTRAGFSLAAGVAVPSQLGASRIALAEVPTSANYKLAVTAVNNGVAEMVTTSNKLSSSIGDAVFTGPQARDGVVLRHGFWQATVGVSQGCVLDIDGDQIIAPTSDGLMLLRAMLGLTGSAATEGAIGRSAPRSSWAAIAPYVHLAALNLGGGSAPIAATDGVLLLRALFGLTGTAVTNGIALAPGRTWADIRTYLNTQCGGNFMP